MADENSPVIEYSPNMQILVDYLTDSLMLSTPLIENDPAYLQLKDSIPKIIEMSVRSIGKSDVEELTNNEISIVSLKSLHTIYLRLATSNAPEFDVTAEQVSFKKGDRFFHYTALAEKVAEELNNTQFSQIEMANVRITTRNGSVRNYNLANVQKVLLKSNTVTEHSVELEWNMFNTSKGEFLKYNLKYSENPIYDEYAVPVVREGADIISMDFYDIRRTKLRLLDLLPNKTYYILLTFLGRDGHRDYSQIDITTNSVEEGAESV